MTAKDNAIVRAQVRAERESRQKHVDALAVLQEIARIAVDPEGELLQVCDVLEKAGLIHAAYSLPTAPTAATEVTIKMTLGELIAIRLLANEGTFWGPQDMPDSFIPGDELATLQRVLDRAGYDASSAVTLAQQIERTGGAT
ncbi:MAG TPA: hypothetical protein VK741_21700 [Acetobacteraceae bacterium]|jgi:hypothetical protein|nr:hypothetical protein [Acetobacteraceae bacterium]